MSSSGLLDNAGHLNTGPQHFAQGLTCSVREDWHSSTREALWQFEVAPASLRVGSGVCAAVSSGYF
eukprot:m.136273 g.136273  ORF g.136273 m.136273 type:complete len:66 (+) comp13934_c0_seq4:1046-1243(+)